MAIDRTSPVILFAMERECTPFRRKFPVQERCRHAPCRAWICGRSRLPGGTFTPKDPPRRGALPNEPPDGQFFLVMEIGVGPKKTQKALDWLAAQWQGAPQLPPFLVMAGFAGSLVPDLRVGNVFIARHIVDLEGNSWATTWPGELSSGGNSGRLVTTPRLIGDPLQKSRLHEKHDAQAVDMEAATVARFCELHGVKFGCVRSISDNADSCLSPHLVNLLGTGQVSIPRLLATLVLHPSVIGSLLRLARDTRLAADALAEALMRVI
jgi:nucleoside phosphorylase